LWFKIVTNITEWGGEACVVCGMARRGVAWRGAARAARHGEWCGSVWCGAARCGVARRGVVWCGVV